jgi:hypothetical protein
MRDDMAEFSILAPQPAESPYLPNELREVFDLLAAYGRKARLSAEAASQDQVVSCTAGKEPETTVDVTASEAKITQG